MSNKIYKDDQIVTSEKDGELNISIFEWVGLSCLGLWKMLQLFAELVAFLSTFASGATMCATIMQAINKQIAGAIVMAVCSVMFALVSIAIHSWLNYERKR